MKLYFMDKMQSVLCLVPFDKNPNYYRLSPKFFDKKRTSLKNNNISLNVDKYKNLLNGKKLIDIRKNQRIKSTILKQKLNLQHKNLKKNINKNINVYEKKAETKNIFIKSQLNIQKNSITQKLKERREKSIIKKKYSSSFLSNKSNKSFGNSFNENKIIHHLKNKQKSKTNITNIKYDVWNESKGEYFGIPPN